MFEHGILLHCFDHCDYTCTHVLQGDSDIVLVSELADKHDSVCSDVTVRLVRDTVITRKLYM